MSESLNILRKKLTDLRDAALAFFREAESVIAERYAGEERFSMKPNMWENLPGNLQERADALRGALRELMARISFSLRGSPLLSEADFRGLGENAKIMAAALRFRGYRHWGVQVHHDEGTVLGVDPPGQEEWEFRVSETTVASARIVFTDAYREVTEMMDYWSPQNISTTPVSETRGENVRSYRQNTAFLLMWINPEIPELDDVRDTVQEVFKVFNIKANRADEIEHEGVITERIIQEITTSEFLFADLTGERPSVYYEVGYAHAIGKRVILFKKKGTKIHFDLIAYNCPDYDSLGDLRRKLTNRLQALTNKVNVE